MIMLHLSGALPACTARNRFTGAWMYLKTRPAVVTTASLREVLLVGRQHPGQHSLLLASEASKKYCQQRGLGETLPCSGAYLLQQFYLFLALDLRTAPPRHAYDMMPSRMVLPWSLFRVFIANSTDP